MDPEMIAALYVQEKGVYSGLDHVDLWGPTRDARTYSGPWPVVAHPPCARWGRYATGGPSSHGRFSLGDDGGCFASALAEVRKYGGVLEHPAASHAWKAFDLPWPHPRGWTKTPCGGWVCAVEQGHYGHMARKATWLYLVADRQPPPLAWGPSLATLVRDTSGMTPGEKRKVQRRGAVERLSRLQRESTPIAFRDALIQLAEWCRT